MKEGRTFEMLKRERGWEERERMRSSRDVG